MLDRAKVDLFKGIPRTEDYDKLLTAEARILYSLVKDTLIGCWRKKIWAPWPPSMC